MNDGTEVTVITGGAGGMGLACARAIGAASTILLADVNEAGVAQAARTLREEGLAVAYLRCDVTSGADVDALAAQVATLGTFRSLVHTAGISPTMADGRQVLEVELIGSARMLAALEPQVSPGAAGVCVGSIAGYSEVGMEVDPLLDDPLQPDFVDRIIERLDGELDSETAYVLAKRGVMRLCERLASSWGARGGRVISLAPGLIDTAMGRAEFEQQEIMAMMADFTPVKRPGVGPLPGRPEEAAVAAFLCADAAGFISGCDIRVDGGLVGAGRHLGGPL